MSKEPQTDAAVATIQKVSLNVAEAAAATGLPSWTVKEAIGNGSLPAKRAGRFNVVRPTDLENWLLSLEDVQPTKSFIQRKGTA